MSKENDYNDSQYGSSNYTMDTKKLFGLCLKQSTEVIDQVSAADYEKPTPDTEWNVHDLAAHMINELSWTANMVRGVTIEQVGDRYDHDLVGDNLQLNWQVAASAAEAAVKTGDITAIAHASYGDVKVADYLREAASDQLIHAWDLGTALSIPVVFDHDVAQTVYDLTLPKLPSMRASGLFAPPVDVPSTADLQTKLLALYGRNQTKS